MAASKVRLRGGEDSIGFSLLDDFARAHHGDAVGHVPNNAEVVGDEEVAQTKALLQAREEIQNLRLHGDVEGRRGFVADDDARLDRKRPGNGDALALSAREGMGKALGRVFRQTRFAKQLPDPFEAFLGRPFGVKRDHAFFQRFAHRHARVKGREGILKDDLCGLAQKTEVFARGAENVASEKTHAPRDAGFGTEKTQGRHDGRGLARPRFADDGERLTFGERERHAPHGGLCSVLPPPAGSAVGYREVRDFKHRRAAFPRGCREPLLSRFRGVFTRKEATHGVEVSRQIGVARAGFGSARTARPKSATRGRRGERRDRSVNGMERLFPVRVGERVQQRPRVRVARG